MTSISRPSERLMSRWSDHIALTTEAMGVLVDTADDGDDALEAWFWQVGDKKKKPWALAEDKVWQLIHRCLTQDHQPDGYLDSHLGEPPLSFCILGGEPLHEEWVRT